MSQVVNLNKKRKTPVNESAILIQNLDQVLRSVISEHGAKVTLDAVQGMIQAIAKENREQKVSKRNKVGA